MQRLNIGNEPSNRMWVHHAYGSKGLASIQENGILCSGTTMGSTRLVLDYLHRMTAELIRLTPKMNSPRSKLRA